MLILAERTDEELRPYLRKLFSWLLDMNWPGAYCTMDRLKRYRDKEWFNYILDVCISDAKALSENSWLKVLFEIKRTF